MNNSGHGVFCTAYFPPVAYFRAMASCDAVLIEGSENYCKQSYRNRCRILSANGLLSLTVPVTEGAGKAIRSVMIDYSRPWLREHKRAMEAAYRSSPFFEYYCDDIFAILDSGIQHLFDLNQALTEKISVFCGLKPDFSITEDYIGDYSTLPDSPVQTKDFRHLFNPKKEQLPEELQATEYYQVFTGKFGFTPNLSILDLLFNEGPNAISYLI